MKIRLVNHNDIPKWWALSREYDCYVKEIVSDLTEWYDGNDTSPAFDAYIQSKIKKSEAFIAVDALDNCLGIIAVSVNNNRITFFGISHKSDFQAVGNALLEYALDKLDVSKPIHINEIVSTAPHIQNNVKIVKSYGFTYLCDSTENGVPVNTYVKSPT